MEKIYSFSQKFWLAKRIFPLTVCFLTIFTVGTSAQSAKVNLNLKDASLSGLFADIEKQTGYKFFFRDDQIRGFDNVTVSANGEAVSSVLDKVFNGSPLTYSLVDNQIVIQNRQVPVTASQSERRQISGVVTDGNGNPFAGVAVVIKGTTSGVATDSEGRYELQVTPNSILVFSFLGHLTQEFTVGNRSILDVQLLEDAAEVEQVVITGIFNKPRESYTGSVTTITSAQLNTFKGQNLIATLGNIDPSINIRMDNLAGSNPNNLPNITIRGSSSLPMNVEEFNQGVSSQVNTPLIIMDGFETSLEKLLDYNDDEIESINILKDASATAIYGSRGSNGVIVIISKQPKPGQLRVSVRSEISFEIPDLSTYDLLNAREKLELEWNAGLYEYTNSAANHTALQNQYLQRYKDVQEGVDTYWLKKPTRTGVGQKYNIRLEGGSEEFRWGTTVSYNQTVGAMKGSDRKNFNGQIVLQYNYKDLIFKNQTSVGWNKGTESNYGVFSDYVNAQPYFRPYDENGNLIPTFQGILYYGQSSVGNPLYDASLNTLNYSKYTEIINNFSIEWNIAKGLQLRGQFGISNKDSQSHLFYPAEHSRFTTDDTYSTLEGSLRMGSYDYSPGNDFRYDGNVTFSYMQRFNDVHQLYAGVDVSVAQEQSRYYYITAEGFSNDDISFLGSALQYEQDGSPTGYENTSRRVGFTGNVNYTYDNRYYIDGSFRMDGSSQFGTKQKFAPFWSVGIGWNIHNEKWFEQTGFLKEWRLRASVGQTGSQQFSAYQALSTYTYYTDRRYGYWTGAYLMGLGNEDLKWQVTDQYNIGTDLDLFNRRVQFTLDFYIKKTGNLLSSMDIPQATGFSSYVENIGEVKNKGFETGLTGYVIRNRDFRFMLGAKLAYNKNKITKLSEDVKQQVEKYIEDGVDVSNLFYEGRSQNALYAVRSLGIDPSSGKELYLDRDGNITDLWNAGNKVYIGDGEPSFRGNTTVYFSWKNLSLNLSFAYHWGGYLYNQTLVDRVEVTKYQIALKNVDRRVYEERWMTEGDNTFFKKYNNTATRASSRFIMKDRVFEFQTAQLQYRFDGEKLKQKKIQSITVGINMSDIFYWSTIKYERGINYPFARRLVGTVSILF